MFLREDFRSFRKLRKSSRNSGECAILRTHAHDGPSAQCRDGGPFCISWLHKLISDLLDEGLVWYVTYRKLKRNARIPDTAAGWHSSCSKNKSIDLGGPQFLADTGASANKDLKDSLEDKGRKVVRELNGFERQQDTTVAWRLVLLTR